MALTGTLHWSQMLALFFTNKIGLLGQLVFLCPLLHRAPPANYGAKSLFALIGWPRSLLGTIQCNACLLCIKTANIFWNASRK